MAQTKKFKDLDLSNAGTNAKDVPEELVSFLKYVTDSTDTCVDQIGDDNLKKIHKRIKELKQSRELEGKYMLFEELLKQDRTEGYDSGHKEGYDSGRKEGNEEGSQRMLKLVMQMTASGKADQIPRLETDKEFYKEML